MRGLPREEHDRQRERQEDDAEHVEADERAPSPPRQLGRDETENEREEQQNGDAVDRTYPQLTVTLTVLVPAHGTPYSAPMKVAVPVAVA